MDITRPEWRDSIDRSGLTPKARAVAFKMADFWKDGAEELWCGVEILMDRTGFSRSSVYRALRELESYGYLVQSKGYAQHRAPRYVPLLAKVGTGAKADKPRGVRVNRQRCQDDNPEVSEEHPSPYRAPTEPTPGSKDQDCESRASSDARRMTAAQKSDHRKLASYMANYNDANVERVYQWMRQGISPAGFRTSPIDRPGAYAANKSKVVTEVPGTNAWQGFFVRHFVRDHSVHNAPTTAASADPWATTKSA